MKTVSIVLYNNGENCGTYDFFCFMENFKGEINEIVSRFVNADFDMLVDTNLYKVVQKDMPNWMNEDDYKEYNIALRYLLALVDNAETVYNWNKTEFINASRLNEQYQYFIGYLLKQKKNTFLLSLKDQVLSWLKNENNKYGSPLSIKQFQAGSTYCKLWEAKRIAESVYYMRSPY